MSVPQVLVTRTCQNEGVPSPPQGSIQPLLLLRAGTAAGFGPLRSRPAANGRTTPPDRRDVAVGTTTLNPFGRYRLTPPEDGLPRQFLLFGIRRRLSHPWHAVPGTLTAIRLPVVPVAPVRCVFSSARRRRSPPASPRLRSTESAAQPDHRRALPSNLQPPTAHQPPEAGPSTKSHSLCIKGGSASRIDGPPHVGGGAPPPAVCTGPGPARSPPAPPSPLSPAVPPPR